MEFMVVQKKQIGVLVVFLVIAVIFITYLHINRDVMFMFLQSPLVGSVETGEGVVMEVSPEWVREQHMENGRAFFTRSHDLYRYDAAKGAESFRQALLIGTDQEALYNFARAVMVLPDKQARLAAVEIADEYEAVFPDDKQIHYIQGLTRAYAGDLQGSEDAFTKYVEHNNTSWQGYLDLSWAHFQQGEFEESRVALEHGLVIDPNNPWLNTSYGVVLHNLGESERAVNHLEIAVSSGVQIEQDYWRSQYFGNNPNEDQEQMIAFGDALELNQLLVADQDQVTLEHVISASQLDVGNTSPLGIKGGMHMSACGQSCPSYSQIWIVGVGNSVVENNTSGSSCYEVSNAAGIGALMAPAKTSTEWNSFYNNAPSGVSFTSITHPH